jgi:hypothetical protein
MWSQAALLVLCIVELNKILGKVKVCGLFDGLLSVLAISCSVTYAGTSIFLTGLPLTYLYFWCSLLRRGRA